MGRAYIVQSAAFLPNEPVANDKMESVLGQIGDYPSRAKRLILRSNGIQTRHYAINPATGELSHSNTELTAAAVQELMARANLDTIPCLACGTSIADQLMPNHALMVQGELGLPPCEAIATTGICLSGLTALKYANMSVACGQHDEAIATGSELASAHFLAERFRKPNLDVVDRLENTPEVAFEQDFLRWMLSDGAGAVLLRSAPQASRISLRIDWIELLSYAGEMPACMYAGAVRSSEGRLIGWTAMTPECRDRRGAMSIKQDIKLLNEHIVDYMVERPIPRLVDKYDLRADDIDYFLPHYSSEYFRDRVRAGLQRIDFDIPQERWFTNLREKGNTGSASIYIILDQLLQSGRLETGQRILCWVPESGRFSCGFMHLTVV